MSKRITTIITLTIVWFLVSIYIYSAAFGKVTRVKIDGMTLQNNEFQVFYTTKSNNTFSENMSANVKVNGSREFQRFYFEIYKKDIEKLRIDFGINPKEVVIKSLTIEQAFKKINISPLQIKDIFSEVSEQVEGIEIKDNLLHIYSTKQDPFIYSEDIGSVLASQPLDFLKLVIIFLVSIALAVSTLKINSYLLKKEASPIQCAYIAIFALLIFLPSIVNVLGIGSTGNTEQRVLAKKPKFVLNKDIITSYPKEYEDYLNDNFGLKDYFVRLNSLIDVKLLNTSPMDRVALGKQGWLYSTREGNLSMIDIYRGMVLFSEDELVRIKNNLVEQNEWLKAKGIPFILMIAPNKETIYPEYLPDNIKKVQEKGRLDQLVSYLKANTDINIIDGREVLINKKTIDNLYYKTDSHWNELGAYFGHKAIMDEVSKYLPQIKPKELGDYSIVKETKNEGGDLAKMLNLTENFKEEHIHLVPKVPTKSKVVNSTYVLSQGLVTESEDKSQPRMLMYRDSFTINMQPFLSEYFSTAVYQWNHSFDPNLVIETKPDVVVHEVVERYIHELLAENPEEMKR